MAASPQPPPRPAAPVWYEAPLRALMAGGALWASSLSLSTLFGTRTPFGLLMTPSPRAPGPLVGFLIDTLKYAAKPMLLVGLSLLWVLLGALLAVIRVPPDPPPELRTRQPSQGRALFDAWMGVAVLATVVWLVGSAIIPALTPDGVFGARLDEGPFRYNAALVLSGLLFGAVAVVLVGRKPLLPSPSDSDWPGRAQERRMLMGRVA